jgi:hypothetical protein
VTSFAISGRSSPSRDRAVVDRSSLPRSTRAITVNAVNPFVALAVPNWVWTVLAIPCARSAYP